MTYRQIEESAKEFPVSRQCEVLGVSRAGYYDWKERPESVRAVESKELLRRIRDIYEESEETYGSPRIHAELQEAGVRCGKNRVAKIMRKNNVVSIHRKKHRATTDSSHTLPIAENHHLFYWCFFIGFLLVHPNSLFD